MLGVSLAGWWPAGLAALAVWLTGALVTRYSSVGGMLAAVAAAVLFTIARTTVPLDATWTLAAWAMAALLILKHADNIRRLRAGTESRIGAGAAAPGADRLGIGGNHPPETLDPPAR